MSNKTIAFIGTGNMSYAIIGGMIKVALTPNPSLLPTEMQTSLPKLQSSCRLEPHKTTLKPLPQQTLSYYQ